MYLFTTLHISSTKLNTKPAKMTSTETTTK